jgi:Tachylectin
MVAAIVAALFSVSVAVHGQGEIPDEVQLPPGKGAWMVFQWSKTNVTASIGYLVGYEQILVQSDGKVFFRKFLSSMVPATPWCRYTFDEKLMRGMNNIVSTSGAGKWDANYGPFLSTLGPFTAIRLFIRNEKGVAVESKTTLFRFYDLPWGLNDLYLGTAEAGQLAFANCDIAESAGLEKGTPVYAVRPDGDLLWYDHTGFLEGDNKWANGGEARRVGNKWGENISVVKGDPTRNDGIVYTVSKEGWLSWFKHNGVESGSTSWADPTNVGSGFDSRFLIAGGSGLLYRINKSGEIFWYKHLGYTTGQKSWANNGLGTNITATTGSDWTGAIHVFSGGGGVIYSIDSAGNLFWNKHLGYQDGSPRWAGRKKVGTGWGALQHVFAGTNGIVYAVRDDGTMFWQKHLGVQTGSVAWANGGTAREIGTGWKFKFVF